MKYTIVLFFSILSFVAQAQNLSLQELVNRKQFPEVLARADSLTAADSASYTTMSAIGQAYEGSSGIRKPIPVFNIVCQWIQRMWML